VGKVLTLLSDAFGVLYFAGRFASLVASDGTYEVTDFDRLRGRRLYLSNYPVSSTLN
jgi:hypothetical protein